MAAELDRRKAQVRELCRSGLSFAQLCGASEELELEMCCAEPSPESAPFYAIHMLAYIGGDDLDNARHLWRRAPTVVKADAAGSPFSAAWEIVRALWKREHARAFGALAQLGAHAGWGWAGAECAPAVVAEVTRSVRFRGERLLGKAFASVTLAEVAQTLGLSEEEAARACAAHGWTVEGAAGQGAIVFPVQLPDAAPSAQLQSTALAQLKQLCRHVAAFESESAHA
eukprot:g915.t1